MPAAWTLRRAVACSVERTDHGDGARWDARRGELLRVDVLAGRVFRDAADGDDDLHPVRVYHLPFPVGAVAPLQDDDGWLLAAGRGFVHLAPDGSWRTVEEVAPTGARMSDAACDPGGRCWAGSVAPDRRPGGGALHRLDRRGNVATMLDGLDVPNGIGWSPDGASLYLVDSGARVVLAFAFDGERGSISAGRILLTVPDAGGAPDRLTVDDAGYLWVAMGGAGCVHRYTAEGMLDDVYEIPAAHPTSCAFGGRGLRCLFVTTAATGWSGERRRADPMAGRVYRITTSARGLPAAAFSPDPQWWATLTSPAHPPRLTRGA